MQPENLNGRIFYLLRYFTMEIATLSLITLVIPFDSSS